MNTNKMERKGKREFIKMSAVWVCVCMCAHLQVAKWVAFRVLREYLTSVGNGTWKKWSIWCLYFSASFHYKYTHTCTRTHSHSGEGEHDLFHSFPCMPIKCGFMRALKLARFLFLPLRLLFTVAFTRTTHREAQSCFKKASWSSSPRQVPSQLHLIMPPPLLLCFLSSPYARILLHYITAHTRNNNTTPSAPQHTS